LSSLPPSPRRLQDGTAWKAVFWVFGIKALAGGNNVIEADA